MRTAFDLKPGFRGHFLFHQPQTDASTRFGKKKQLTLILFLARLSPATPQLGALVPMTLSEKSGAMKGGYEEPTHLPPAPSQEPSAYHRRGSRTAMTFPSDSAPVSLWTQG